MKNLKKIKTLLLLVVITVLVSCNEKAKEDTIDGVYQSIGYGRIVKIIDNEYIIADVTDISCIPLMDGEISEFGEALQYKNDTLSLKDGINTYYFTKIDDAPAICKKESQAYKDAQAKTNDPEYNFEVLWKTFEDHYAYWDLRNVDPKKMYAEYRPQVTAETTEAELFFIMYDMLESFNDGHIGIEASEDIEKAAKKMYDAKYSEDKSNEESTEKPKERLRGYQVSKAVAEAYISDGKSVKNGNLRWGIIDENIGYLQVNQMFGLANYVKTDTLSFMEYWGIYFEEAEASGNHTNDELIGLNEELDKIMNDFKNTDALIIDVRFNGGGKDEVGMEVLKRVNDTEKIVFSKKGKLGNGFTPTNNVTQPSSNKAYSKPVYLLISSESASATEIMTLSSLSIPNITRVGSTTEGVFSDVLDRELPNGWEFGLSSEVYLDTKGNNYEGIGIAPDIKIEYSRDTQKFLHQIMDALKTDQGDLAIEKARSIIMEK